MAAKKAKKQKEQSDSMKRYLEAQEKLVERRAGESLEKYYRRLAKVADQRLVRLEAYSHDENFKNVLEWSYSTAKDAIKYWSGEGAARFNTAPPEDQQSLMSKISDIKHFLTSATGTKKGIIEVYKERTDTINKEMDTSFTWQDLAVFFERAADDKLNLQYGSETKFKAIGVIQKNDNADIIKAIEEANASHLKLSDDDEINYQVEKFLKENGKDLKDVLGL